MPANHEETDSDWSVTPIPSIGQTLLFSSEIELAKAWERAHGRYTAADLKRFRPQVYDAVIEQLAMGTGLLRIGKMFGIHHRTAAAVREAEPESIDIARSKLVAKLRTAATLQVERLIEDPEAVPMNVAGLVASQLLEKMELLDGRATVRSEELERGPDIHDKAAWERFIRALPRDEKQLDGRVIDLDGGEKLSLEAPAAPDPDLLAAAAAGQARAGTDAESEVRRPIAEGNRPAVTTQATTQDPELGSARRSQDLPAAPPDVRTGGGGGVGACAEGGLEPIGPITQEILGNEANP